MVKKVLLFVLVAMALVMSVSANAAIIHSDEVKIDLTDPNSVGDHGLVWTPHKKVQQTDKGLVFSYSMTI